MNLNQKAARVIRSLMRESHITEHLVFPHDAPSISAEHIIELLEAPKVGDGTIDAALAIGEHAFRAGFVCALEAAKNEGWAGAPTSILAVEVDKGWSSYDPPEDIKALA